MVRHRFELCIAVFLTACCRLSAQAPPAEGDIRGPKPLVEIPVPDKPDHTLWISLAAALVLTALVWFIWRKFTARKRADSPQEIALSALAKLERDGDGIPAETFAYQAANTLRQYISERFGLAAPRRTSEEFLRDLSTDSASPLAMESERLKDFLKSCDLAKFAGSNLDADQRGGLVQSARDFIRSTANPAAKP